MDGLTGMKILLAEDTEVVAFLVSRLLEAKGAQIDLAVNGLEAVNLASSNKYSVVLMDIRMPVMDGLQAAKILRSRGIDVPIIALSANVLKEDREASLAAGCNAHLAKPVDANELVRVVRKVTSVSRTFIAEDVKISQSRSTE